MKQNEIMKMLYDVQHPGKGDRNIVELGMVEKVKHLVVVAPAKEAAKKSVKPATEKKDGTK